MSGVRAIMAGLAVLLLAACGGAPEAPSKPTAGGAPDAARLFSQCAVCHTAVAPDAPGARMRLVGPPLWGVYGRAAAAVPEFNYSRALRNSGLVWDEATLDAFLQSPQRVAPGTIMSYPGESDPARRALLIEYMKSLN